MGRGAPCAYVGRGRSRWRSQHSACPHRERGRRIRASRSRRCRRSSARSRPRSASSTPGSRSTSGVKSLGTVEVDIARAPARTRTSSPRLLKLARERPLRLAAQRRDPRRRPVLGASARSPAGARSSASIPPRTPRRCAWAARRGRKEQRGASAEAVRRAAAAVVSEGVAAHGVNTVVRARQGHGHRREGVRALRRRRLAQRLAGRRRAARRRRRAPGPGGRGRRGHGDARDRPRHGAGRRARVRHRVHQRCRASPTTSARCASTPAAT